ncbi:amidohydrolase family protein [Glaciihabitans sp. UYNi722]|uniref:amidohydrolase family protein n=1 Tax=Glaciihabitans sp. UYNi722 TaxID=3156344 RepID=UPI003398F5B1
MSRLLVKGATVITVDPAIGVLPRGDILIDGDLIAQVGPAINESDAEIVDGTDWIVTPGFVDTHRHTWQSAIRHSYGDVDPLSYFREVLDGIGTRYAPEDVYAGTLLGAVSAVSAGTTTLFDWAHIQNSPAHSDASIRALTEAGIRAVFGHGWPLVNDGSWTDNSALHHPDDIHRIHRMLDETRGLVSLAVAARGPEMASQEVWEGEVALAREMGIRLSVHVGAYARNAEVHAVARYAERGLLGADLTFVHCNNLANRELDLIADSGATVSLGPHCELNSQGVGDIPLDRLLARGVRPSLSGDTETKCSGDMFTQMRVLFGYYRSWVGGHHSEVAEPYALKLADVLEFATLQGARALGMDDRIGSITPGKQADLVCIRASDLNIAPVSDPVAAVVLGAHEGNVDTVFIGGQYRKRAGRMVSDPRGVVEMARESRDRLMVSHRGRSAA